jgi:pimeloyl-ACP methyl ester carboxylesterase
MNNPILLLHGALGASTQLQTLKQELERKGHSVFLLNFSGHGGTPFSEDGFGIEVFAEDVNRFIDQHALSNLHIFGYSMGGYVAMWFALLHPDKISKITTLGTKFDWSPESATHEVKKVNPEKIEEKIPAFARILEKRHAPNDWKELLNKTASMMRGLGDQPLLHENNLMSINCPVTIGLGGLDDMADKTYSGKVSSLIPKGKFVMLPNTPHPIEKVSMEALLNLL